MITNIEWYVNEHGTVIHNELAQMNGLIYPAKSPAFFHIGEIVLQILKMTHTLLPVTYFKKCIVLNDIQSGFVHFIVVLFLYKCIA